MEKASSGIPRSPGAQLLVDFAALVGSRDEGAANHQVDQSPEQPLLLPRTIPRQAVPCPPFAETVEHLDGK
jgi:hypothetical protein